MQHLSNSAAGAQAPQNQTASIHLDGTLRSDISSAGSVEPLVRELTLAMRLGNEIVVHSHNPKEAVVLVAAALPALIDLGVGRELGQMQTGASGEQERAEERVRRRPSVIAFPDQELTYATAFWFELVLGNHPTYSIWSFGRTYRHALRQTGEAEEITPLVAAKLGYGSQIAAIRQHQPHVWEQMRPPHADLQQSFRACAVVLATEDALVDWQLGGSTAAFVHGDFFDVNPDEYPRLAEEARPRFAVLGPSGQDDRLCLYPVEHLRWVIGLMQRFPEIWGVDYAPFSEKLDAFRTWQRQRPAGISFEDALAIERDGYGPDADLDGMRSEPILPGVGIARSSAGWIAKKRRFRLRPDVSILVTGGPAE